LIYKPNGRRTWTIHGIRQVAPVCIPPNKMLP